MMRGVRGSWAAVIAAGLALGTATPCLAHSADEPGGDATAAFAADAAIARSESAVGRRLGDYSFVTDEGRLEFLDLRGQPLVLNLVYTSCADVCPMIVQSLGRAVAVADEAFGAGRFAVLTVGFDAVHDTPLRLRAFAAAQGIDRRDWHFASADGATIERLAADLGFTYFASPKGFDHLAQTTIIDGEGRVYRQVYGADFSTPAIVEPLKDLVYGRRQSVDGLGALIDRIRLFCTIYDPARDRYRFSYAIFISLIGGTLTLGGVGFILARAILRLRRIEARHPGR